MRDVPDILNALRQTPLILSAFIETMPQDRLHIRRAEGFWTIAEHVDHLARAQSMLLERFERFLQEDHPVFVPYAPTSEETEVSPPSTVLAAVARFRKYREKQLLLLDAANDDMWTRTATHPEYEFYSLHILARHTLMHDYWHMYRMEELWLARDAYLTELE